MREDRLRPVVAFGERVGVPTQRGVKGDEAIERGCQGVCFSRRAGSGQTADGNKRGMERAQPAQPPGNTALALFLLGTVAVQSRIGQCRQGSGGGGAGRGEGDGQGVQQRLHRGPPVGHEAGVVDGHPGQVTGVPLGVEHVAQPEQQRTARSRHGRRAKLGHVLSCRQRPGHFQRIAKHEHGRVVDAGRGEHLAPERQQATKPGILEREQRLSGEGVIEQPPGLVPVALPRWIREPFRRDGGIVVPAGAG